MRQGRGRKGGEKSQNREYMQPHTYDQQNLPLQAVSRDWNRNGQLFVMCTTHAT